MNTHRMSPIGHLIELGNGLIFVVRGREEREKKKKKKEKKERDENNHPLIPSDFSREDGATCHLSFNSLKLTSLILIYSEDLDKKLNYKDTITGEQCVCIHIYI